jgi:hypothetical protein
MTVVLVAASVGVKIELNESTAPAAIKMLKVRIVIPPNIFYRAVGRPTINVGHHSQFHATQRAMEWQLAFPQAPSCPLLALSRHRLVRCTCLLLTQSGHGPPSGAVA